MDVDHVVSVPDQRPHGPFWIGDLLLKRLAADEVVIELDVLRPSELDRAAIPGLDVVGLKASGDIECRRECRHGRLELGQVLALALIENGWKIVGHDGRKAGFEVIDEGRASAEPTKA